MFLEAAKLTDACEITDPESDSLLASSGGKKKLSIYQRKREKEERAIKKGRERQKRGKPKCA